MLFYFIGITGVGKSTIGKRVAREMKYSFVDLDALVELRNKMRLSDIFDLGEDCFRTAETIALEHLQGKNRHVIATGGGVVERQENIELMRESGIVVLLHRPLDDIYEGMSFKHRPLLRKNPRRLWKLYEQRKSKYEDAADLRYFADGSGFDVRSIARDLLDYEHGKKLLKRHENFGVQL